MTAFPHARDDDTAFNGLKQINDLNERIVQGLRQRAKADADVSRPNPVARRAERMAMLDAKLLDDSTMGDLSARAARERKGGR